MRRHSNRPAHFPDPNRHPDSGVASLASAFQFAGAESAVLSLWELPSEATLPFMRAFYQQLKQGRSKLEALQSGRDALRRQYPDPYYWAVFALYSGAA